MTPLDVVKTRLQVQQKNQLSSKCYLYCNGLMDHICKYGSCPQLEPSPLQNVQKTFNGTAVSEKSKIVTN
jgi:hypothetical protein